MHYTEEKNAMIILHLQSCSDSAVFSRVLLEFQIKIQFSIDVKPS